MQKEISKFVKNAVEGLQNGNATNYRFKLDDHLAVFVGWSAGYGDEVDENVIQSKDDLDWGINAGIKVWTSDDLWCDYDFLNFPFYENGDVMNLGFSIGPNDDYDEIAESLLDYYKSVKGLELDNKGRILGKQPDLDEILEDAHDRAGDLSDNFLDENEFVM